jgi:hypothetical protein
MLGPRYLLPAAPSPAAVAAPSAPASEAALPAPAAAPVVAAIAPQAPPSPRPAPEPAAPREPIARPVPQTSSGAPRFGALTFASPVELQVFEGDKRIGSSGVSIALLEGVHSVELVNEALGFRGRETVTIKPGEMTSRAITMPNGRVSINAVPWADVWIDNNAVGQTPLANLSIPVGEHQITFRHPQLGEQKQTAVVSAQGITRLSASMQR